MIGPRPLATRLLIALAVTAPPAVAVGVRAYTISSLPDWVFATVDVPVTDARLQASTLPEFTAANHKTLQRAQAIASASCTNPFLDASVAIVLDDPTPTAQPNLIDDTPPELVVSSLLEGGPDNTIAMIDGQAWRIGETVTPGWVLVTINARDQFIEIENAGGKRVRVALSWR